MDAVYLKNIKKSFDEGKEFVLNGMNVKIPKGKLTVVIGYSGTGKSVMLKHMLGLIKPTSGTVSILGRDIWKMTDEELIQMRCRIGMLFQHAALFDDMTVLENVCFPYKEHWRNMPEKEMIEAAIEKIQAAGLDIKHVHKKPSELSGGMQKRVGLARALALDPEILIYDEPTTGLDPILTEMVDNLIVDTHNTHEGATSIVVSHDLLSSFRIGEYIIMLDKGKVLLEGQAEDFMNSDIELVQEFISKGIRRSE